MELNNDDLTILQLPNELLMKVFEYVPCLWNVSMVCRQFYEVLCKVEMNAYKLTVKHENIVSLLIRRAFD